MPKTIHSPKHRRLLELLIEARLNAGLTQVVLAERIGRQQSFVAKYENGERRLDVLEFIEVVQALGADPKDLIVKLSIWDAN